MIAILCLFHVVQWCTFILIFKANFRTIEISWQQFYSLKTKILWLTYDIKPNRSVKEPKKEPEPTPTPTTGLTGIGAYSDSGSDSESESNKKDAKKDSGNSSSSSSSGSSSSDSDSSSSSSGSSSSGSGSKKRKKKRKLSWESGQKKNSDKSGNDSDWYLNYCTYSCIVIYYSVMNQISIIFNFRHQLTFEFSAPDPIWEFMGPFYGRGLRINHHESFL